MYSTPVREEELRRLGQRLGLRIHNLTLFDRALTHSSITAETGGPALDYESLEFLGDAVLGLAVAHYLFESAPERTPGEYSRMRAVLVNRRCVARVGQKLDISPSIRLGRGEELSGGRDRTALLADCMEALIGAVYLDRGWLMARDFVIRMFQDEFDRAHELDQAWDFKSRLQNYCQSKRIPLPQFVLVRSEGPDHRKEFEVEVVLRNAPMGRGRGTTKKEAEQNAAREALEQEGVRFE
ncbi:MAG: ribonuclease III [Candidatus Hydrogenedentes bacterium]|nr:ribonuclease III [Candidatus Hydrogenedentota bacterium]